MPMTDVYFVMGATCSGKSTFLDLFRNNPKVGLVEVGKAMRAKYPPEHFKGQDNPQHTAQEAWEVCVAQAEAHKQDGCEIVLVDGQPRDIEQTGRVIQHFSNWRDWRRHFILLYADLEERERRARETRAGDDLESLAIPRLTSDMQTGYAVLSCLLIAQERVRAFETSNYAKATPDRMFSTLERMVLERSPFL